MKQVGLKFVCKPDIKPGCMAQFALSEFEKQQKKKALQERKKNREDKKRIERRIDLYSKLGRLVNQFIKHVLRKGEPCYTCGKQQRHTDKNGAFHAGHYMPAKQVDPRRFIHANIRIQCYTCNSANSGRGSVYRMKLCQDFGEQWVLDLECENNYKSLREVFPEKDDIRAEILRYRKLLRDNGLTPNA